VAIINRYPMPLCKPREHCRDSKLLVCCDINQSIHNDRPFPSLPALLFHSDYCSHNDDLSTSVKTTTIMFAFNLSRRFSMREKNKTLNHKMKNKATQSLNTIILSCSHPRAFHSTTPLHYYFQRSILHPELQQSIHTPIDTHES